MEAGAAWVPCDFQLANWTMQPAAVCAPGFPVEYVTTEVSGGGKLVEFAAPTQNDDLLKKAPQEFEVDIRNLEMKTQSPIHVFEKRAHEFDDDIDKVEKKIHRYPTIIRDLGDRYTIPTMVAIGPYHHYRDELKPAEKLKHVAAYHCISESGHSVQEMYDAVVSAVYYYDVRSLYDKAVVAGIVDDDFLPMMFYDACFLVQFMISSMDSSLGTFLDSNEDEIFHDVMLLENQIPWPVVEAVMSFRPLDLQDFVSAYKGCLQDRKKEHLPVDLSGGYRPPHLLGLLRHYIVGRRGNRDLKPLKQTETISFSVNAIELAEMGITLKANKTTELIHMGVQKKGTFFAELSMTPVSLNDARASWLVNMAALELCTTLNFPGADDEESAVCSYLLLLAMFVDKEEDVQELRAKRLLQGGGGLTNQEALVFFTSLQSLRLGSSYVRVMQEIQDYKDNIRPVRTKLHAFVYKNKKTIAAVFSAIGALAGIIGTLKSLKGT